MFNGSWREAQASVITIDIPDDNIDAEGMIERCFHNYTV